MGLRAFVLLVVAPITELVIIVRVANWVGWGTVALALICGVVLGTAVMRRSGRDAWQVLSSAVRADGKTIDEQGRPVDQRGTPLPGAEQWATADPGERARLASKAVAANGVRFAAGLLLALPGFLSDVVALLLLVPPVSALLGEWLVRRGARVAAARRLGIVRLAAEQRSTTGSGTVISGSVISENVIPDPRNNQEPDRAQGWPQGGGPVRPAPQLDPPTSQE